MVVEGGGPAFYHLQGCKLASPINELVVYSCLYCPNLVKPVVEGYIFPYSPEQGHRGVGMHIDKARNGSLSTAVHNFSSGLGEDRECRSYAAYEAACDADVLGQTIKLYVA